MVGPMTVQVFLAQPAALAAATLYARTGHRSAGPLMRAHAALAPPLLLACCAAAAAGSASPRKTIDVSSSEWFANAGRSPRHRPATTLPPRWSTAPPSSPTARSLAASMPSTPPCRGTGG